MKNKLIISFAFLFIISLSFTSAAYYIAGEVLDAKDGTSANDHTIIVWNSLNGMQDNVTDIIGQNGNSGQDNIYLIDCELLYNACSLGEELSIKVIDTGDGYTSSTKNIIMDDQMMQRAPTLQLIKKRQTFLCNFFRC